MKTNYKRPDKGLPLLAFVILSCILIFISCQKEVNFILTPPPNNILSDSTYLEKIYDLDSISSVQIDTAYFTKFEYDNLKRVRRSLGYNYAVMPHALMNEQIYFYQGQDTLPFKMQNNYSAMPGSPPGTSFTIYFYTSAGKLSVDSTYYLDGSYFVRKYILITGGYSYVTIAGPHGGIFQDTTTFLQTIQNGHIVKETAKYLQNPPVNYFYEYDAKPNPLKKLNLDKRPILTDGVQYFYQGVDANNVTKTIHQPSLGQSISNHWYLYHPNGLPHRVYTYHGTQPPNTADSIGIVRFEYTDL